MREIQNTKMGAREFGKLLGKHGQQVVKVTYYNRFRHCFIETYEGGRYYLTLKRQMFMTYEWKFGVVRGEGGEGAGETMNKEYLQLAKQLGAQYIVFIYKDGKSYGITPADFEKHGNERTTQYLNETTISVPMNRLKNMEAIL